MLVREPRDPTLEGYEGHVVQPTHFIAEAVEAPDANHMPLRTAGVWQGQDCQGSMYLDILECDFSAILQNYPCHCLAQAVLGDVVVLVYLACCHTPEPFFTPLCLTPSPQS